MGEWWQQSGTTSTAQTGAPVIAGTTGEGGIATCSVVNSMLKNYTLTSCKMSLGAIYSQNASDRLQTRSVSVALPGNPAKGANWGSTDIALWKAPTPISLIKVTLVPQTAWQFCTCGEEINLWGCSVGILDTYCTTTTELFKTLPADYVFPLVTHQNIAACEYIRIGMTSIGACSDLGYGLVQIDYWTTG